VLADTDIGPGSLGHAVFRDGEWYQVFCTSLSAQARRAAGTLEIPQSFLEGLHPWGVSSR
jgi:hypothetical protein